MKDDADRNLKLRHRRAPAAENKPSYSPPEIDVQTAPDSEAGTEVQDAHGEAKTYPEEAAHNLTKVKSATDDGVREEEVLEEVRGNVSCGKDDGSETTDDIEDDSCCCVCQGKDELEEENQDSIDEGINEGEEAEDEFVEELLVPQGDEICPSTREQEPSSQPEKCDYEADKVTPQVLESDHGSWWSTWSSNLRRCGFLGNVIGLSTTTKWRE